VSLVSDSQASDNIDVANRDFLDVVTVLGEDLHSRAFISSVADHKLAVGSHDSDFAREPELTFFLARNAEMEFESSAFLENLKEFRI
jgi:hypothetical protein